jgi:uncharacterized protein (DUF2147 family)
LPHARRPLRATPAGTTLSAPREVMRTTAIIAGIGLTAVSGDDRARAADSTGTWRTEGGKATVRIGKCGGDALCGTIVALQEQNDP